ncbi:hypothetical protein GDO86_001312 [Hymenochirus boettgeri]|uniref:Guanylate cyclase n=1 Tax=Hymenochirus boettgeri TaxID=247094 RepID=A0A8T2KHN1_9PIPI|nr:hypothetical protein GDO86_001312 [Hymenochirus boettgeri]
MEALKSFLFVISFTGIFMSFVPSITRAWHDLDNTEYDCWPLESPDEVNMIDCGGLEMTWVQKPPERIISGETFDVTYSVTVPDKFYHYAVTNGIFPKKDAASAKRFCEEKECPSNWKDANGENCCVHHANIHSYPLSFMIFTHTISTAGKMTQTNWSAKVVLFHHGVTSLIAHIRVGNMQVALEAKTLVLPAIVCGNGVCEEEEVCSTCPADCGECPFSSDTRMAFAVPVALIVAGFILGAVGFQYQRRKTFWDESWIINFNHIKQDHSITQNGTGSSLSAAHAVSVSNASRTTALSSCTANVNTSRKQFFTQTGRYDGKIVAIKKIQKKTFTLSKTIRREVKQIRDLDHPNLCKFIGGCTDVPNVAIITEYCPKGSLMDVLLSEDIPLNWGFRFSFAYDIAQGMAYLHQHKIYHTRLKARNCVIDDRWVCKITDYGLDTYRKVDSGFDPNINQERLMHVYLPPESETMSDPEKSAEVDMYSYAIILLEIATRSDSMAKDENSSTEYCCLPLPELIKAKSDNGCPCPSEYIELIRRCRSQNPTNRPTFEQVKKQLYKMNPNKVSPVDMMMTLMEKYSKHLELLVAERTQDLMLEKQKTDRLLYSMLPRQVADDLRQGKPLQAQSYTAATVFFSDIVGFTQLSSSSTPYQVVDFLNKLYTTFDEIIDNYDVYKVETIGDAYMVVSGVPKENGILHVSEISSMALDLVSVCKTFRIPHKPNTQLKIRAGIHSGPVVAGVVGTKMPRYCLFGDTVNTASRMESTSEALKIQCSSSTYDLLKQIGGYILACRGTLQVKGKGDMTTYWLEGKKIIQTKNAMLKTCTTHQENEKDIFKLIPGVLSSEALSSSF